MSVRDSRRLESGVGRESFRELSCMTGYIFAIDVMSKRWNGRVRMQRYLCNRALAEALFLILIGAGLIVYTIFI